MAVRRARQRIATGWEVMVRIFSTTTLSFDVSSVMQPRSTFTTSRCSLPLATAPRSAAAESARRYLVQIGDTPAAAPASGR